MSDAITLDVLSSSPVQLDVGDADPIAREEIAELTTRVTTVEGDVSGLSTRMGAVEGDISALGTTVDGIDARVEAIEADYVTSEDVMGALVGEAPTLVSGSSRAVLGDTETASWMERTTAADGAALIEAIYGNTVVQDGSLLPVRMTGVETVGFNQWDEQWEVGDLQDGLPRPSTWIRTIRSKNFMPCFPNTTYYLHCGSQTATSLYAVRVVFYDSQKQFISNGPWCANLEFTTPSNCAYFKIYTQDTNNPVETYGGTYNHDICVNISDPSRNGTYEPYWSSQRTIPASTYFPDGMRSAGSVRDELRADAAVTRVGAVDLGTLTWTYETASERNYFRARIDARAVETAMACSKYDYGGVVYDSQMLTAANGIYSSRAATFIYVKDTAYTDAATFKAAMDGVMLHYELATPTTTPIDPPLPLSYRTGAGGTERVMVASGITSAPPIFATRYPLDPADLAASIAPVDGPTAKTNHQVGDLLMLGFTLCKATQVIVTGETIAIGTNVTKTTVAAELAALSE